MMEFGKRLLPAVVDYHANTNPARVFASMPRSPTDLAEGFQDVTMADLAGMVNKLAWWIESSMGIGKLDTLAYIGPADIRYTAMFLAIVKSGYKALFISPRNQLLYNVNMLEKSKCKALFYADEMTTSVEPLTKHLSNLITMNVSPLATLLKTSHDTKHFPFQKTFERAQDEPCLILHSSGSTGEPKLVTMTHGTFSVTDNDRNMPVPEGRQAQNANQFNFEGGAKFYSCFPPYHLAGVHAYITLPIFSSAATVVFGPTSLPPSGYLLAKILQAQNVRAFYVPPNIIEQWFIEPAADEQAKKLEFVLFGGGPLSPHIGDKLSKVTNVCQMYGSLEIGQVQLLIPRPGEWSYLELNPYEECDMQSCGDGSFEMVLHQDPKFAASRTLWHNFREVKSWRTGDLFVPHPSKTGLWRFHSRVDDMIVLSTSYKIRPQGMETMIQGHHLLSGALVVGQGKPEPLLIVEPKPGVYEETKSEEFIELVWPIIQQANKTVPPYARIARSNIIVAHSDKPFFRAPKGTVVRKLTINAYADEIEAAYGSDISLSKFDQAAVHHGGIDDFLLPAIRQYVRKHVESVIPGITISDVDNFFRLGLDSLGSAELSRSLQKGLASRAQAASYNYLSLRVVYKHPTIDELARIILNFLSCGEVTDSSVKGDPTAMKEAVEDFTANLPSKAYENFDNPLKGGTKVAVIGPRGSLGPNVVREFMADPQVAKIYCLGQGDNDREKMRKEFESRCFSCDVDDKQLEFMKIDFAKPRLGLSDQDYDELVANATIIVHNGWRVDFSWTLESYLPEYLHSIRELVDLCSQSRLLPRIVFISSIASVQEWATIYPTPVTEASLPCYEVTSPLGYGQSKHVAERILIKASEATGIPVTILRVGEIAPTTTFTDGSWSTNDWIPSLAVISKKLQLIPTDIPPINWIPVDLAAKAIFELSMAQGVYRGPHGTTGNFTTGSSEVRARAVVFNVVNPKLSDWALFADALGLRIHDAKRVSLGEWVDALVREDPGSMSVAEASSSTKILPFFQHLAETAAGGIQRQPKFETGKAVAESVTMAAMKAVDEELIGLWMDRWGV